MLRIARWAASRSTREVPAVLVRSIAPCTPTSAAVADFSEQCAEIVVADSGGLAVFSLAEQSAAQDFRRNEIPLADNLLQRTAKAASRAMGPPKPPDLSVHLLNPLELVATIAIDHLDFFKRACDQFVQTR
jgi:hypothetical protein